jgi:hypothetical protein
VKTSDKLKFVGHFHCILALLSNSPAVSFGAALIVHIDTQAMMERPLRPARLALEFYHLPRENRQAWAR